MLKVLLPVVALVFVAACGHMSGHHCNHHHQGASCACEQCDCKQDCDCKSCECTKCQDGMCPMCLDHKDGDKKGKKPCKICFESKK